MLSIYAVPNTITTAAIIAIIEKFSLCYISKVKYQKIYISELNDKIDKKL